MGQKQWLKGMAEGLEGLWAPGLHQGNVGGLGEGLRLACAAVKTGWRDQHGKENDTSSLLGLSQIWWLWSSWQSSSAGQAGSPKEKEMGPKEWMKAVTEKNWGAWLRPDESFLLCLLVGSLQNFLQYSFSVSQIIFISSPFSKDNLVGYNNFGQQVFIRGA